MMAKFHAQVALAALVGLVCLAALHGSCAPVDDMDKLEEEIFGHIVTQQPQSQQQAVLEIQSSTSKPIPHGWQMPPGGHAHHTQDNYLPDTADLDEINALIAEREAREQASSSVAPPTGPAAPTSATTVAPKVEVQESEEEKELRLMETREKCRRAAELRESSRRRNTGAHVTVGAHEVQTSNKVPAQKHEPAHKEHAAADSVPDTMSAEEILRLFESRSTVVERTSESERIREKCLQAAEQRAAQASPVFREAARPRYLRLSNGGYDEEMRSKFGEPAYSDEAVQQIADELLREAEAREMRAMTESTIYTDYRHLDAAAPDDDQLIEAARAGAAEAGTATEATSAAASRKDCAICLESLIGQESSPQPVSKLGCGHEFHAICVKRWMNARQTFAGKKVCPLCEL